MPFWSPFVKKSLAPTLERVSSESARAGNSDIRNFRGDMAKEYWRSIYLWRAVDMIGSMAASVPMRIERDSDDDILSDYELSVERLLNYPNPMWSSYALKYFVAISLAASNKAFLFRVRGVRGITTEIWPLAVSDVNVVFQDDSPMIKYFEVLGKNGTTVKHEVDKNGDSDVIYIWRPALNQQTDKSPAYIAAAPAEVFTRILQRSADILANASNITSLLSTKDEVAPGVIKKITETIAEFMVGRAHSGGTLVTSNAEWKLTRLSEDPSQSLSVPVKDSLARDVVMTFGVPTQLVGHPGSDTYNNLAQARVGFLTDTILPNYIDIFVAALNHVLLRDKSKIIPVVEHIPAMIAGRRDMIDSQQRAVMLTLNEQRKNLGYPPFDDQWANVPVRLLDFYLKQKAIEAQMKGKGGEPTGNVGRLNGGGEGDFFQLPFDGAQNNIDESNGLDNTYKSNIRRVK